MLRSKISLSVSAALLLGMVSITGCGNNDTAGNNKVSTNSVRGADDSRLGTRSTGTQKIDKFELSQELADRIAEMAEVRTARVMLAGNNAYVAVTLNDASTGMEAKGTPSYRAKSSTTPHNYGPTGVMSGTGKVKIGRDGMNGTGMTPNGMNNTMNGSVNTVPGTTSTGPARKGILGMGTGTGTTNNTHDNGSLLNNHGAKRDTDMGMGMGMRSTSPNHTNNSDHMNMNTGNNNNNTMNTRATDTVTKEVKDKIAAVVKKQNPKINSVYVSANPDFVERANYYADEVSAGHPIKGFVGEFQTMIERIFPTRSH